MFIRDACQCVVYCFYPAGSQIAVGIEMYRSGEPKAVCFHAPCLGALTPLSAEGLATATMLKRFFIDWKRFVWRTGLRMRWRIFIESFHFICGIPFCQDGYIDTLFFISTFQQILVRSDVCEPFCVSECRRA